MMRASQWLRLAIAAAWGFTSAALAWIYPEHRDIAVLAVTGLDAEHKAAFDRLWAEARIGDEQRMCARGADVEQGLAPPCIDWAALSAIAGDHSCSSREMLDTVRKEQWILVVADVAAQLKIDLARTPVTGRPDQIQSASTLLTDPRRQLADAASRAERTNALRTADTRLQRADHQYATRADANLAHFLLPRPDTNLDPGAYGALALLPGSDLNAAGVYAWFHLSALQKASRLANEPQLSPEERRALARSALFDEAFALHFLEDMYAAGHIAGSWGDVSQRKGTHDFYNASGLEVFTWEGRERTLVVMGDAHMRPEDAEVAAKAVRDSIEQLLDTATGRTRSYSIPDVHDAAAQPDAFDICKSVTFPDRGLALDRSQSPYRLALREVLLETPVPGLGPGLGALPRARSEVGAFAGLAATLDVRAINGGFVEGQNTPGAIAGVDLGFRAGFGLEGALGNSGDGLVFLQFGLRADTPSSNDFNSSGLVQSGALTAAIPARSALTTRIRMPFYLVPGDLLFLAPMYWIDRDRYTSMAVTASNGGLLRWQQGWATRIGRFQFVLGRELGIDFYGLLGGQQQLLATTADPLSPLQLVNFKSINYDLPILEYRPYRAFSTNQSSTLLFQLFAGVDVPYDANFALTGTSANLKTVWNVGLRMVFDWRYYW